MQSFLQELLRPVNLVSAVIALIPLAAGVLLVITNARLFGLMFKNLKRNLLRTLLTCLAIMVLVFMITMIWTVISFLDKQTTEKAADIKLIVSEKWQAQSLLPPTYAHYLDPENSKLLPALKEYIKPGNFMSWSFYVGTTDPTKMSAENFAFFFCMDAHHIISMMEDLDKLDPKLVERMLATKNGCLFGPGRLEKLGKRVGERIKLTGLNFKGIDLDFEILGELPEGRYAQAGIMNASYLNDELDKYAREKRVPHALDQKRLSYIWLRVPDRPTFDKVGAIIESATEFSERPVKVDTASSLIGSFLDAYRDLLNGVKYLLVPAILATMALVVANSISISVRERRTEMAVLKVLGFRPGQILLLVLGEAMLVGGIAGLLTASLTWGIINATGGINFQVGFFPVFPVPVHAFFWGLAMGFGTSFAGSIVPALSARSVRVAEVFAKVA